MDNETINTKDNDLEKALLDFIERKNIDRSEIVFDIGDIKQKVVMPDEKQTVKSIIGLLDEYDIQGDGYNGVKINQDNLDRLNKANVLACILFNPSKVNFKFPQSNWSSTLNDIITDYMEWETAKQKSLYQEFISLIDSLSVSALSDRQLSIQFSVKGIWEE